MKKYFITAIHTDSGKSLVSAIFTEALKADYWKPVQAGSPTDTNTLKELITNKQTKFHPEAYCLSAPMSPHAAAKIDKVNVEIKNIKVPHSSNDFMVIEGAGGILVPINDSEDIVDMIPQLDCEVIVVSNYYLGSINHTLLTLEVLQRRGIKVRGVIFNGEKNEESMNIIQKRFPIPCLLEIPIEKEVSPKVVEKYAKILRENLI